MNIYINDKVIQENIAIWIYDPYALFDKSKVFDL